MQVKLNNSDLILLLPQYYVPVTNGADLYKDMYHKRKAYDIQMFHKVASESYGNVIISHIELADSMPFNKEFLIKSLHETLEDDQGIIEVETGTNPRGFEYVYSIIKTYHQEALNVNYCLRMNIRNGNELIEVIGNFFESRMTGLRSSMGWNLAMRAGFELEEGSSHAIKGWAMDPYDPEYSKGCRMIMCERPGLDGMFPSDPLSQTRELVLALSEDSFYKTEEEMDKERKSEKKKAQNRSKKPDSGNGTENDDEEGGEELSDEKEILKRLFSKEVERNGAYKVAIISEEEAREKKAGINPVEIAKKIVKTVDAVKTPFDIPSDFRCKLNKPIPKELPGWGKREYIGFGKSTFAMNGVCLSWPVSESESLPLEGTDKLIQAVHDSSRVDQVLISAKCGLTPKGNRYAYTIRKMAFFDESGEIQGPLDYELNFNIRINGKNHFINGSFQEVESAPGGREGSLSIMSLGSSELKLDAEHWLKDPYGSGQKQGVLMKWTEDEKYDGLFPYHPLSEMREFTRYVVDNN